MNFPNAKSFGFLAGDGQADSIVPPSGHTAWLTVFTAGAMAFLAVFALALSLAAERLADRWGSELARSSTVRISAPDAQIEAQTQTVLSVLATTPGVARARALTNEEQSALLEPWFGPDLPLETLPIPQLVEIVESDDGYDTEGLRLRLAAEAPGAILDDHTRWRRPLVSAAGRMRTIGYFCVLLIMLVTGAMITLAAKAALSANIQVIRVLRLIGARDAYVARAFVRRFTLRTIFGAGIGSIAGVGVVALLPSASTAGGFLTGLGFQGAHWLLPLLIPVLAGVVAFWATKLAALRTLRGIT